MRRLLQSAVPVLFAAALTACPSSGEQAQPQAKASTPSPAGEGAAEQPPPADQIREAKGVDVRKLDEAQLESFWRLINTESSACDKPHSLAKSIRDDEDCRDSMLVAQVIADRLAAGMTPADIKRDLDAITAALTPKEIDTEGRPVFGNPRAPVTVVVFADFQCPRCKAEAPVLREEVEGRRGQAKLVFKHFPLSAHPRAEEAAIAAEAAGKQGKFWEMHDLVFAHQTQLSDEDLERYAGQIPGLDVAKWKADYVAEETKAAVAEDRAEGKRLALTGTPTVFVNGRRVTPLLWEGELSAWIDDALRR